MKKRLLMPLNLQFFAEGGEGGNGEGTDGGTSTNSQDGQQAQNSQQSANGEGEQNTGKTFSRDDVAKMIAAETNKAKAVWEKELEAKKE